MSVRLNTTVSVAAKAKLDSLAASRFPEDWYIVAYSVLSSEAQLKKVAKKCANYKASSYWSTKVAQAICENPNTTRAVLVALSETNSSTILNVIIEKGCIADEAMLVTLANACERIAVPNGLDRSFYVLNCVRNICKHRHASPVVGSVFVDSSTPSVLPVIMQYPKVINRNVCLKLAQRVVKGTSNGKCDFWFYRATYLLCSSHYFDKDIADILATSNSKDVTRLVQAAKDS